jgi:hypothetical protein
MFFVAFLFFDKVKSNLRLTLIFIWLLFWKRLILQFIDLIFDFTT